MPTFTASVVRHNYSEKKKQREAASYHQIMILISRGLKGRVLKKLKIIHQFHQNQRSVRKRKKIIILAAMKDVPIMQGMEECVLGTVLRERGRRHAVKRDVPIR